MSDFQAQRIHFLNLVQSQAKQLTMSNLTRLLRFAEDLQKQQTTKRENRATTFAKRLETPMPNDKYIELHHRLEQIVQQQPGLTNKEIGAQLNISDRVCYEQLRRLYKQRRIDINFDTNESGQAHQIRYFPKS